MPMWGINPSNGTAVYNGATYAGEWFDSTPPNLILNRRYQRDAFIGQCHARSHHSYSPEGGPSRLDDPWVGGWKNPQIRPGPHRRGVRPVGDVFGGSYTVFRPPTG